MTSKFRGYYIAILSFGQHSERYVKLFGGGGEWEDLMFARLRLMRRFWRARILAPSYCLVVMGCSDAATVLSEDAVGDLYEGMVDIEALNGLAVRSVDDDTMLIVEFYDCDGEVCAEATVDGEIDTIGGEVDGSTEIENILVEDETLEGEITYDDWTFKVRGEFLNDDEELMVDIRLPAAGVSLGEITLMRVIVYEMDVILEVD